MKRKLFSIFMMLSLICTYFVPIESHAYENKQMIIINKKINKLAFFNNGKLEKVYPVATGKTGDLTPEGTFKVLNKIKNRPYYKKNIKGGDPKNPLGDRWMGLNARGTKGDTYGIHGNNKPKSIGTYASSGCVRMNNSEIRQLFDKVKVGTPVIINSSNNSFDYLASVNGYQFTVEDFIQYIQVFQELKLYKTAKFSSYTGGTINQQELKVTKKAGNWYQAQTFLGNTWIYTTNVTIGKQETFEKTIKVTKSVTLYKSPTLKSQSFGQIKPQDVQTIKKLGETWYCIKTYKGNLWVNVQ